MNALIIDDNIANMTLLSKLLKLEGLSSIQVSDPLLLESLLPTIEQVGIVFVDLEMPGLSGYDILPLLRSQPVLEGVPVVACTVHTAEINTAYQEGFDSFLGKPLNLENFPQRLRRILNGETVWEAK